MKFVRMSLVFTCSPFGFLPEQFCKFHVYLPQRIIYIVLGVVSWLRCPALCKRSNYIRLNTTFSLKIEFCKSKNSKE